MVEGLCRVKGYELSGVVEWSILCLKNAFCYDKFLGRVVSRVETARCEAESMYGLDGLKVEEYVLDDFCGQIKKVWGVVRVCYCLRFCMRHGVVGVGRYMEVDFRDRSHCIGYEVYM